ncbi:response regulator transcription factor [Arachidicoccus ginsenosidivorans]|jgi:DNA-binding NarL/FixJ family response regulator|uniref:Response regulator transcription factor n=1 Tax=Arachidicoccus ginsenosidivorans TaxID=496057 RepID=A0A5B8VKX0_9BACT|nr:response regulator transcription factor [Arachidicoccus ginsenosidivorans]QEC71256.1 response regulator transcription factor [Arachidicoccus ginsenosidivorans]
MRPTVLIAEDHSVVRMGTMVMLEQMYPNILVSEAASFDEVIEQLSQTKFDLIILDIHIPGGDNIKMIETIHLRQPGIRILIFSSYDERLFAINYIQAGAMGYVQKDASNIIVKIAIAKVLNDEQYISADLQKNMVNRWLKTGNKPKKGLMVLSAREREIMNLLIKGHRTNEIKTILNIQASTISTHKERIFTKLNVENVIELEQLVRAEMKKGN